MNYRHFGDLVADFAAHDQRTALTERPFLKIETITYHELQRRIHQTANYLTARGIAPRDRIMVVANNSPEWVELFLGAQLIGSVLIPIDATSSPATTLRSIDHTQPTLIFRNRHRHSELDGRSDVDLLDELNDRIREYPERAPNIELKGDLPAVIVFTSGTTADPKGVVLTQRNILADAEAALRVVHVRPDWRFLSVLPLSHMYELTSSIAVLSHGAGIFYVPSASPVALARGMQDYRITTILAVPQLLSLLLERVEQMAAAEGRTTALARATTFAAVLPFCLRRLLFRDVHSQLGKRLNLVITGGAPIPIEVGTAWERMGVRLLQGYGLTETGPILTMNPLHERRADSAGRALDNVRLRIAGDGEIQARGPNVFHEYWHNPTATREAFTDDGWFRTGDAGSLRDGWLYVQGRLKFAIVLSSGLKVFPEDIELVADKTPILRAACVVGRRRPAGEEVVAVVISDHSDREIKDAIDHINRQVESFQHISEWLRWPEATFPLTRLRKTDRKKVQDWANEAGHEPATEQREPQPGHDAVVELIRQSLDDPEREVEDSDQLADLGLDSLRRLTLAALIEEQLGVSVEEQGITPTTTVGGLRQLVDAGGPTQAPIPRPSWPYHRWLRLLGDPLREVVIHAIVRIKFFLAKAREGAREIVPGGAFLWLPLF